MASLNCIPPHLIYIALPAFLSTMLLRYHVICNVYTVHMDKLLGRCCPFWLLGWLNTICSKLPMSQGRGRLFTCVSAFVEILLSLQCKIFQYTFLRDYPIKFQDFVSLCQIQQLAWLQIDHRKLGLSKMRLLSDPVSQNWKRRKNTLSCVICCFEKHFLGFLLNLICIKIAYNIYFIHTNF